MNKDQIIGAARQAVGSVKVAAGEILNNDKLETRGKVDKLRGKIQSTAGDIRDVLKP